MCFQHLHAQAEIIDETDVYEDVNRRVLRRGSARADVATFLTMCAWIPCLPLPTLCLWRACIPAELIMEACTSTQWRPLSACPSTPAMRPVGGLAGGARGTKCSSVWASRHHTHQSTEPRAPRQVRAQAARDGAERFGAERRGGLPAAQRGGVRAAHALRPPAQGARALSSPHLSAAPSAAARTACRTQASSHRPPAAQNYTCSLNALPWRVQKLCNIPVAPVCSHRVLPARCAPTLATTMADRCLFGLLRRRA